MSKYMLWRARLQATALCAQSIQENALPEFHQIHDAICAGLTELGFQLIQAEGRTVSAIEASRGHERLVVRVDQSGQVATDWVGLSDGRCERLQADVTRAAARHGVEFVPVDAVRHNDPRGARELLIPAAARVGAPSLAHAIVQEADGQAAGDRFGRAAAPVRERMRSR